MIESTLSEPRFSFVRDADKRFIVEMTRAFAEMGYTCGDEILDGICWGRYMLLFRRAGAKTKKVVARIYIRDESVALRLFFSDVTKRADAISAAPDYIKHVFTGDAGACKHCRGDDCRFRKDYELDGRRYERCNGEVFLFENPTVERVPDYARLFGAFYPTKPR